MIARPEPKGALATLTLERVEIDHTKLDIIVSDDLYRVPLGRPWLTLCIDHYTRMPIGYYMGFMPPGTDTVLLALRNSIRPKDWVRERYPSIEGDWPCHGVPEVLVTDNGPEFHSADLELAALQIGMGIQHTKMKAPWMKGVVERFFGEVNRNLLAGRPGTTFHSTAARGDYDSEGNAAVSLGELDEMLCHWLIEIHGAKVHSGISDVPLRRWREGIERFPPRLPANARDLDILLARSKEHRLHQSGVRLNGLWYNNPELAELRARSQQKIHVSIKFDPQDISTIHVLDPTTRRYFPVDTLAMDYARGLGLWQHKAILRMTRERNDGAVDIRKLAEAKERLHVMIEESMAKKQRNRGRSKAARFLEAGGERPVNGEANGTKPPPALAPAATPYTSPTIHNTTWFDDEDDTIEVTFDMSQTNNAGRAHP